MNTLTLPISVRIGRRFNREESGARPERKSDRRSLISLDGAPQAHQSVMAREVLALLAPKDGDVVLDATAGAGGHSEALLSSARIRLLALDADPSAVAAVRQRLARFGERVQVIEANFRDAKKILAQVGVARLDKALFDLGWNRGQLYAGRGFSFMSDEPLHMSYGGEPASGFTARDIVNDWREEAIADALFGYGEERYARRIAKAIVERRAQQPIETTGELVDLVMRAVPAGYRRGRMHPATKTFQALRIAVNDELGSLEKGIRGAWDMLAPGGRLAVISFHSIEDRAVKRLLLSLAQGEQGALLSKKPLTATAEEIRTNPSARSAKLRGIEKKEAIIN